MFKVIVILTIMMTIHPKSLLGIELNYHGTPSYKLNLTNKKLSYESSLSNLKLDFKECNQHLHDAFFLKLSDMLKSKDGNQKEGGVLFEVDKVKYFTKEASLQNKQLKMIFDDVKKLIIEDHLLKCNK